MRSRLASLLAGVAFVVAGCAGSTMSDPPAVVAMSFDAGGDVYGCVGFVVSSGVAVTAGHCVAGPGGASPVVTVGDVVAEGSELHPGFGGTSRLVGVDVAAVTFGAPVDSKVAVVGEGPLALLLPDGAAK